MRLIDADKLVWELKNPDLVNVFPIVFDIIGKQKTIEQVKRGKWIERNDEWFTYYECSACRRLHKENTQYCHDCGAIMEDEKCG